MTITCHSCNHPPFADYTELAKHIMDAPRKTHRHGRTWASKVLLKVRKLDSKKKFEERVPLTEEQKEAKRDLVRELSGLTELVQTYCPKCKTKTRQRLPVEYTRSREAWRTSQYFMIMCPVCSAHQQ